MTSHQPEALIEVALTVNGIEHRRSVPARLLLSDFLRDHLRLTGTHVGCEHGVCGACTVVLDGLPARSCLTLVPQADGAEITTVEGLDDAYSDHPAVVDAFQRCHGLQCGFCTPGILCSLFSLRDEFEPTDRESVRAVLAGHLCRCNGYQQIVDAVCAGFPTRVNE